MLSTKLSLALPLLALSMPVHAQEFDATTFSDLRAQCTAVVESRGTDWAGWQRNYGNGYGDSAHLYSGELDGEASLLDTVRYLDGSVMEGTTWCFRSDGSVATIELVTAGPDLVAGNDSLIVRTGRLYLDETGKLLSVQGWLADTTGAKIGALDSAEHELARPCNPVDIRPNVADAQRELESVLGTLEGDRPSYEPTLFDWCAEASEGQP